MSTNYGHDHHPWCPHATGVFDISNPCIRAAWSSIIPAAVVALFVLGALLRPVLPTAFIPELIRQPFRPFVTIEEAEALEGGDVDDEDETHFKGTTGTTSSLWRTVLFVVVGLLQSLCWLGLASYHFYTDAPKHQAAGGLFSILVATTWFYTTVRPIVRPQPTAMYDVLVVYVALLLGGLLNIGGALVHSHWERQTWVASGVNVLAILVVLAGLLSMPLNIPTGKVHKEDIVCLVPCTFFNVLIHLPGQDSVSG